MNEKQRGKTRERKATKKEEEMGSRKEIEFSLYAPEAREVFLAGEFNQWDNRSMPMKKDKEGFWKTKVKLPAGSYEYKFFVDGAWVEDVASQEAVSNLFGTQNLVMRV